MGGYGPQGFRHATCKGEELGLWEGEYTYRCIITNDYGSTDEEIVEFYYQRGAKERIFDDLTKAIGIGIQYRHLAAVKM